VGAQFGVYCASKYAVRAITEGLRQEMSAIRVTLRSQPADVDVNEMIVRSVRSAGHAF
jgi:NADP-dependent 3-hydroxy acid dehydrogenase YdfG